MTAALIRGRLHLGPFDWLVMPRWPIASRRLRLESNVAQRASLNRHRLRDADQWAKPPQPSRIGRNGCRYAICIALA